MRLIHLTDPHLTSLDHWKPGLNAGKRWLSWLSWQTKRRARHRRPRLKSMLEFAKQQQPDAWALTGDLCQLGLESEVREAAGWLAEHFPPESTLLVPGNHDHFAIDSAAAITRHWADFLHTREDPGARLVVHELGDVALIGLHSAVVTPPLKASGKLGAATLERLSTVLDEQRGRFRVVLIHHPPVQGLCTARKTLDDAPALTEILADKGAAMVLHGHLHYNLDYRIESKKADDIEVFCTASASAAGKQGLAAARMFKIERQKNGFLVNMQLLALDASNAGHVIEKRKWTSKG
ncbi:MAG: metallophosphoesterase [Wenzhouxiangellaceae bacterium]|nr:metallophosphoesterase [Wenzhouxiangellaceae bacterium]